MYQSWNSGTSLSIDCFIQQKLQENGELQVSELWSLNSAVGKLLGDKTFVDWFGSQTAGDVLRLSTALRNQTNELKELQRSGILDANGGALLNFFPYFKGFLKWISCEKRTSLLRCIMAHETMLNSIDGVYLL